MVRNLLVIFVVMLAVVACTTVSDKGGFETVNDPAELMMGTVVYHKVDLAPELLRLQISYGRQLVPDHPVRVTTLDGQTHELTYRRIEEGQIVGDETIVAIDHVAALEITQRPVVITRKQERSVGHAVATLMVMGLFMGAGWSGIGSGMVVFP